MSGGLVSNIFAALAEFYSLNLAEETKKGMRQKVLQGGWPHQPPRGYIIVREDGSRKSRLELHPKDADPIRKAFERYATGWVSLKGLASILAREGVTAARGLAFGPAQMKRTLSNPFYIGRLHWQDLDVQGSHPPLISAGLFERVQATLRKRFKDPGAKGTLPYPTTGLGQ